MTDKFTPEEHERMIEMLYKMNGMEKPNINCRIVFEHNDDKIKAEYSGNFPSIMVGFICAIDKFLNEVFKNDKQARVKFGKQLCADLLEELLIGDEEDEEDNS